MYAHIFLLEPGIRVVRVVKTLSSQFINDETSSSEWKTPWTQNNTIWWQQKQNKIPGFCYFQQCEFSMQLEAFPPEPMDINHKPNIRLNSSGRLEAYLENHIPLTHTLTLGYPSKLVFWKDFASDRLPLFFRFLLNGITTPLLYVLPVESLLLPSPCQPACVCVHYFSWIRASNSAYTKQTITTTSHTN